MLGQPLLTALLLCAASTACDRDAQPVRATLLTGASPAHCVDALEHGATADPLRCPAALRQAVAEAQSTCRDVGGKLSGADEGNVWGIDVNGDGRQEPAVELESNVVCRDVSSLFSCGSLGCPKALYELRDGTWTVIGGIWAAAPEQVELATRGNDDHRALQVCSEDDCRERWIYEWLGTTYEATRVEVRGAGVDMADSIHGLYPLAAAATLRAAPIEDAPEVGRYAAGTEVEIIGTAEGGEYYYVSPCNACESGFVQRSAVAVP
jgi:hypothetical protein